MVPFIHYNMLLVNELNFILKKNSIKYLISFHKNNINSIFFKREHFYEACFNNNLNIIKYIYNNLQNKNIDLNEALYSSCNQYNLKLIFWLIKISNFNKNNYNKCLYYCINYNNLKLFKFFINKFDLNIENNNHDLFYHSLRNKNINFIKYLYNKNINLNDYNIIKNIYFSNNSEVLDLILNDKFIFRDIHFTILDDVIRLGYDNSFNHLIKNELVINKIKLNIYKYICISFNGNNLTILKKLLLFKSNQVINYNYVYSQLIIYGNLDIIKYIYEKDNSINLYDYICLEKIIKNKYFDKLIFIFEKKPILVIDNYYFKELQKLINLNYIKIILNLNNDKLVVFFNYLRINKIKISYYNITYIINKLIINNQISKIDLIEFNHPFTECCNKNTLFEDSLKSNNFNSIKHALSILNKSLEDYKYEILHHAYINGIHDIIYALDDDNKFRLYSYNLILNKSIYRNDYEIIKKIISKDDFNPNQITYDSIELLFKLSNSKVLNILMPKFDNMDFFNTNLIYEIISSDNFDLINIISQYIDIKKYVNNAVLLNICKFGNQKFIDWFIGLEIDYINYINSSFNTLILYGHYEQSINFYNKDNHKKYIDLSNNSFNLIKEIVKDNNIEMIKWFIDNFDDYNNLQFIIFLELQENLIYFSKYDNVEIIDFLIKKYKLSSIILIKNLYIYSFDNYNYNMLNYLIENFNIKNYDIELDIKDIFFKSIENNYYKMIDIIIKNFNDTNWLFLITYLKKDNEIMFEYILENYKDYLNISNDLFFNIIYQGNINYIKLFVKYCNEHINLDRISEDDFMILFTYNNTDLIDYIYSLKNIDFNDNINILKLSVNLNKTEIVRWLLTRFKFSDLHDDDDFCFETAFIYKNLELLKLLYLNDTSENFDNYKLNYLRLCSKIKDLDIFIWISEKIDDLDYTMNDYELITNSLVLNNIFVFKYILNNAEIDINFNDGMIITSAFGNNNEEIIKFLLEKYKNIDVLVKNEIIMKYAIEDANIEILDLLFDYNSNFNLSRDNEYLFRIACKMDNLDIVKWLIEKKSDIDYTINDHEIFYYICEHNFIEIALYFQELNSELYEITIKDNEIENYSVNKILIINDSTIFISKIDKCPICLEVDSQLITNCNHQLCFECTNKLNKKNICLKCPLCRTDINSLKSINLIESKK